MSEPTASRTSWFVLFGLIVPSAILMAVDKQAMVVLATTIRDYYHLSLEQTTQILSAAVAAYAMAQIPAGWLCERFGPPLMLALACITWSLAVMALPLATTIAGLFTARVAMGICQSPDWAASVMIIRNRFPTGIRGRASSSLLSGLYFGMVIGGPICVSFLTLGSWQSCFYTLGILGLCLGAAILWFLRHDLKPAPHEKPPSAPFLQTLQWFFRPQCLAIGCTYFFLLGIQSFFTILMPLYLTDARHMTVVEAGHVISFPFMFLYASVILCGFISDFLAKRTQSVKVARIPLGIIGLLGASIFQYCAFHVASSSFSVVCMCASLFMVGAGQVCVWTSIQDLGQKNAGLLVGWTQLFGNGANAIVPVLCAHLVQTTHGDWNMMGRVVILCGLAGAGSVLLVRPHIALPAPGASRV